MTEKSEATSAHVDYESAHPSTTSVHEPPMAEVAAAAASSIRGTKRKSYEISSDDTTEVSPAQAEDLFNLLNQGQTLAHAEPPAKKVKLEVKELNAYGPENDGREIVKYVASAMLGSMLGSATPFKSTTMTTYLSRTKAIVSRSVRRRLRQGLTGLSPDAGRFEIRLHLSGTLNKQIRDPQSLAARDTTVIDLTIEEPLTPLRVLTSVPTCLASSEAAIIRSPSSVGVTLPSPLGLIAIADSSVFRFLCSTHCQHRVTSSLACFILYGGGAQ